MSKELYNTAVLTLAAGIPHLGRLDNPQGSATKVAKLCGSRVMTDVVLDDTGRIVQFAQEVKACALGQAAAAILGQQVMGLSVEELRKARDEFAAMIKEDGPIPSEPFGELEKLMGVREYKARHASTLLPFEAALAACELAVLSTEAGTGATQQ